MLIFISLVHAVPVELAHQGRLLDAAGDPLEGTRTLTFTLRDDSGDVWTQEQTVTLAQGHYSVILGPGGTPALDSELFSEGLSLQITDDEQALAAMPLAMVPTAVRAVSVVDGEMSGTTTFTGPIRIDTPDQFLSFWPFFPQWPQLPADHSPGPGAAGSPSDGFGISVGHETDTENTTAFLMINDNTNDAIFIGGGGATCCSATWRGLRVLGSGNAQLTGTLSTSQGALYSDLAEHVPAVAEAGDVVIVDGQGAYGEVPFVPASAAYDTRVVGVISDSASLTMATPEDRLPLALSGFVKVKVDASYGAIQPGDLLVASPTPGHAMRAEEDVPGAVIGKAVEPLAAGTGRVLMLVLNR